MGHLLLHLYAREKWKLDVMAEASKKRQADDTFELKGVTDFDLPCNWALYHEQNTVAFILDRDFEGSWQAALDAVREFVYNGEAPKPTTEAPQ